jgi:hypothetical protein
MAHHAYSALALLLVGLALFFSTGKTASLSLLVFSGTCVASSRTSLSDARVFVRAHARLVLRYGQGDGAVSFGYPNKCFFTVGKSAAGSWWFVDPLGKPFLSLGVTSVSYWGDTSTTGTSPPPSDVRASVCSAAKK